MVLVLVQEGSPAINPIAVEAVQLELPVVQVLALEHGQDSFAVALAIDELALVRVLVGVHSAAREASDNSDNNGI